ncbi:LOW QUALITY PROTEIN: leucyl-cystinyl aminopeptidase [Microcaecilia unicolor]|uniref:Leucyl-cystinyl aminopeptidase n=1 Tax=Microcaecilia unicolor TaxID=1415580 RepID=A0A6P7XF39_9AMPH|nr:LOW QUALITY PROTEIN: leucyl-cystinyl aminopeptidase [Microcaecilia unicolor]
METFTNDRVQLPRNMIENSMFEEEPDVVDLAKEPGLHPLEPDEIEYEPRSSRLLVRGLGEHEMEEDEEDYESSAKLLGMSFMNRSSGLRNSSNGYNQTADGLCSVSSKRTMIFCAVLLVIVVSVVMVVYLLPKCTFTKEGCVKQNSTVEPVFPWAQYRLPDSIRPLRYDLVLHPNLTTGIFTGFVQIMLEVTRESKSIILHSSGLNITNVTLTSAAKNQIRVTYMENTSFAQIAVVPSEPLSRAQTYNLSMEYSSNFSDTYYGFYKIACKDGDQERCLAATQFEPLAARTVFPCFDEPAFKSVFQIKIKRSEKHIALSNMPKNETIPLGNDLFEDVFLPSVTMSTYLVAFIVGDLKNIRKETNGTLVSVYAVPQKLDQVHYALETAVTLFEFYRDYFEIGYPLQKLDLVAIPDFQAGAMENWGLIIFRETALLYDDKTSSILDKLYVTSVIAHELAHQWFGNLVTMEWWNDLWLNEGFATYMEYFSLKTKFPELQADDNLQTICLNTMAKDSLNSSYPVSSAVETPVQIDEMFDALSYIKGASILQMLKAFLSEDVFHHAIVMYLTSHEYGTTKSDDLWDSMNKITNGTLNVTELMRTWTLQKGFPLVTVKRKGKSISLRQEYFLQSDNMNDQNTFHSSVWHIPLEYYNSSCEKTTLCSNIFLLDKVSDTIEFQDEVTWVKFNVDMNGYYMVNYGDDDWEALIQLLRNKSQYSEREDRTGLINNIFILAGVGKVQLRKAFDLIDYLVNETSTAPIVEALSQFNLIHGLLGKRGMQLLAGRVEKYIFRLLNNIISNQTWTDEGTLSERQCRSALLDFACSHGLESCTTKASKLFEEWRTSNRTRDLPADVMKIVFTAGAKTPDGWEDLLSVYNLSLPEAEKNKILDALCSTEDANKLIWLMQAALQGDEVRTQDLPQVIATVSQSLAGNLLAWDFVKENWGRLIQKFRAGTFSIQHIVSSSTSHFSSQAHLLEVQHFFEATEEKSYELHCVKEALQTIRLNIQWMEKNVKELDTWV